MAHNRKHPLLQAEQARRRWSVRAPDKATAADGGRVHFARNSPFAGGGDDQALAPGGHVSFHTVQEFVQRSSAQVEVGDVVGVESVESYTGA